MPIVVQCTQCGTQGEVSRSAAGFSVKCHSCGQAFKIVPGMGHITVEWGVTSGAKLPIVPGQQIRLGRAEDNELSLPGAQVSRHHALVFWQDGEWRIRDLDSANGTLLDGRAISEAALTDGAHFVIGEFALRVALAGMPKPAESRALDALAAQESRIMVAPDMKPLRPTQPRHPRAPTPPTPADVLSETVVSSPAVTPVQPPDSAPAPDQTQPASQPRHAGAQRRPRMLLAVLVVLVLACAAFLIWNWLSK